MMVINKGTATAILSDETHALGQGDVILASAGKNTLANRSNEPVEFLFFYPAVEVHLEHA